MIGVLAGLGSGGMSLRKSMNIWYSIVEQNTSWRLTRSIDILIAISGVARELHKQIGHTHSQGFWVKELCKGLLWVGHPGG